MSLTSELSFDTVLQGKTRVRKGERVRVIMEFTGNIDERDEKYVKISQNNASFSFPLQAILAIDREDEAEWSYISNQVLEKNLACNEELQNDLNSVKESLNDANLENSVLKEQLDFYIKKMKEFQTKYEEIKLEAKLADLEERSKSAKLALELSNLKKDNELLKTAADVQMKEHEKRIKQMQSSIQDLEKKLKQQQVEPQYEKKRQDIAKKLEMHVPPSISPSPLIYRPITIHYDTSQKFPLVDDVESCLVQAQQNTFYQFKHVSKDNSPCNLLLYFDIVEDRVRDIEAKKELAKSLLAKTNNNCVWVFVCFKPSSNEEATKIAGSIKGLASGLTLPSGQFVKVYLTAEYQIKSNQRDKQGNFLHVIANKDELKQQITWLANMKVTGAPVNFPGIVVEPMPSAPMNHVAMNHVAMNPVPTPYKPSVPVLNSAPTTVNAVPTPFADLQQKDSVNLPSAQTLPFQKAPLKNSTAQSSTKALSFIQEGSRIGLQVDNRTMFWVTMADADSCCQASVVSNDTRRSSVSSTSGPNNTNAPTLPLQSANKALGLVHTAMVSMFDYPSSLQELARLLTKEQISDPSKLKIEAKDIEESWIAVDSEDALQDLPLNLNLPSIEFRAEEK